MKYAIIFMALLLLAGVSEILGRSGGRGRGGSRGRGRGGRNGGQRGGRGGQQGRGSGGRRDDDNNDDDDDDDRRSRHNNVLKYAWLTDLDEANTNLQLDVDEFARVNTYKNLAVMVSRDKDLFDTEFNRHHTLFDFATGKMGIRFRIPLPPGPLDNTNNDGKYLQNHGGFKRRFFRPRPLDVCFLGDSLTSMTQTMAEFDSRQSMVEVATGARASYSVAAANKLTSTQLQGLSPAIARFCCRAAKLGNVYQLSSSGIVVPGTTAAPTPQPTTTQAPSTQAPTTQAPTTQAPTTQAPTTQAPTTQAPTTQAPTTQPPTTTTAAPIVPNHPGVGTAITTITPPPYFLASGFMNPANPGQSIPYQISFAPDVQFNYRPPRPFRRRG